jgi:hypothetical protein
MALGEAGDGLRECALVIVECDGHRASWVLWGTGSTASIARRRAVPIIEVSSIQALNLCGPVQLV